MQHLPVEVVILRPTTVFLTFLSVQLANNFKIDLKLLNTDCSAYIIPKHQSEENTLKEIETKFPIMFRYEIARWLGFDARNNIENNYLDFTCCFRMQFHSHIIWQDPIENNAQLLIVKPRIKLLQWLKSVVNEAEQYTDLLEVVKLSHVQENSSVIIKTITAAEEITLFLHKNFQSIAENALHRFTSKVQDWPVINSFACFKEYFFIEIHTHLIYLHR